MSEQKSNLAVMFVDVNDSTRLYEALGDTTAFGHIRKCLGLFKATCQRFFGGRVIKTIGDGALMVFSTADEAVKAACELQRRIEFEPPGDDVRLSIRVGIQFGSVIEENADIFGDCVNVAARLAGVAGPSEIITTAATANLLTDPCRQFVRPRDAVTLKGKADEVEVREIFWQLAAAAETSWLAGTSTEVKPVRMPPLRLSFRGRPLPVRECIRFGRHMDNTVVIRDLRVSRHHAHIEQRGERFVLVDHSRNGTWLATGGAGERRLVDGETELAGVGMIAFGASGGIEDIPRVLYCCAP